MEHFQIFFVVRCCLKHSRFMKTSSLLYLGVLERLYLQFQFGQVQLWKDTFFLAKRLLPMLEWLSYISYISCHRGWNKSDREKSWQFNSKMQRHWHESKSNNNATVGQPIQSPYTHTHTPIMIRYGNKKPQWLRGVENQLDLTYHEKLLQWIWGARFVDITNCHETVRPSNDLESILDDWICIFHLEAGCNEWNLPSLKLTWHLKIHGKMKFLIGGDQSAYFQGVFSRGFSGCVGVMAPKNLAPKSFPLAFVCLFFRGICC